MAEEYPTYEVGGRTYYRTNPNVPEWQEKAMTWGLDKAARGVSALAPFLEHVAPGLASQANWYGRAVLDRNPAPLTEKDMTPAATQGMAQAAMRGMAAGRSAVNYNDYGTNNPAVNMVGRANFDRPATGGVTVNDQYDFHNYERTPSGQYGPNSVAGLLEQPNFVGASRWLAQRAAPEGKGVPVSVKIPAAGMLQAKQELYGQQAPAMLGMPTSSQKLVPPISSPMAQPSSLGLRTKK